MSYKYSKTTSRMDPAPKSIKTLKMYEEESQNEGTLKNDDDFKN